MGWGEGRESESYAEGRLQGAGLLHPLPPSCPPPQNARHFLGRVEAATIPEIKGVEMVPGLGGVSWPGLWG